MLKAQKGALKQHKIAVVAAHMVRYLIGTNALDEGGKTDEIDEEYD